MTRPLRRQPQKTSGPGALLLTLVCLLAVAGCGDASAPESTTASGTPRAADHLVTVADLPEGWRDSNSQGVDYRVTVCGVDVEPQPPLRATSIRFSQGAVGPFLEEHVRIYADDGLVGDVVDGLREALPGCDGYEVTGTAPGSPTARFDVEPLTVAGAPERSVAWRQVSRGEVPITSDVLLVDRGDVAVLLMSYALKDEPDPAVLASAARALDAQSVAEGG